MCGDYLFALKIVFDEAIDLIVAVLMAHTKRGLACRFCRQNGRKLLFFHAKRLFAKHVDIAAKRLDDHFCMQIMGRADMHGIGLFLFKHFVKIGIHARVRRKRFFYFLCALENDIAKQRHLLP